jgi:hypothetical protein
VRYSLKTRRPQAAGKNWKINGSNSVLSRYIKKMTLLNILR